MFPQSLKMRNEVVILTFKEIAGTLLKLYFYISFYNSLRHYITKLLDKLLLASLGNREL